MEQPKLGKTEEGVGDSPENKKPYIEQAQEIMSIIKSTQEKQREVLDSVIQHLSSFAPSRFYTDMLSYGICPKVETEMQDFIYRVDGQRVDWLMDAVEKNTEKFQVLGDTSVQYNFEYIKSLIDKYIIFLNGVQNKITKLNKDMVFNKDLITFKDLEKEIGIKKYGSEFSIQNQEIYIKQ